MNTKAVKSFGLALMLAAGVIAVLLALGTFSPQKVAGQATGTVTVQPTTAPGGAATPLRVNFDVGGAGLISGQSITVTLDKFGVPASIDAANITISTGTGAGAVRGNPLSVVTDPKKGTITMELGNDSDGLPMDIAASATGNSITFAKAAGLTAPTASGNYPVRVDAGGGAGAVTGNNAGFAVSRSIKLSPESGDADTVITVSGVGFGDGTAKIYVLDTDPGTTAPADTVETIATATVSGGAFSADVKITVGTGENEFANGDGNWFTVVGPREADEAGAHVVTDQFTLTGKVTVDGGNDIILGTRLVEVTLEDAAASTAFAGVTVGGVQVFWAEKPATGTATPSIDGGGSVTTDTSGDVTILVNVESTEGNALKEGDDQDLAVVVAAGADPLVVLGSTKVNVNALTLAMSPATVIQGNDVTLTATGFGNGEVESLTIQGSVDTEAADEIEDAEGKENVAGNYAFTFTVPDLPAGKASVTLKQDNGQIGKGSLTVSAPTISIDPAEGRIGSTVAVEGTGFPAKGAIHVTYGGATDNVLTVAKTVTVVIADANGEWSTRFAVPGDATRGSTGNKIQAFRPELDDANLQRQSNVEKHTVPQPGTTVTPEEGLVGATITAAGTAHAPGASVAVKIGASVVSATGLVTDSEGDFSVEFAIPDLAQRFPVVTVEVNGVPVKTQTIEILQPEPIPATRDAATEFAGIGDALESVFRFDNATKTWAGYNPDAPAAANDLTIVNTGDRLWIAVSEEASYGGETLTPTWNLVVAP